MEGTKRAKSREMFFQKARALRHALDNLLAGTATWMEEVVEFVARHMGFLDQRALASSNDLPGMENVVPHCGQECAHHAALMNPTIWNGLPVDLLLSVFARLPLADIIRLRCLSKEWNMILNSHDFKQVCADAHSKMFAFISESCYSRTFEVMLYDLRSNSWHEMEIDTGYREPFDTMNAIDGGLVCFACTSAKEESIQVPILVCNPLTRAVRALPLHSHNKRPPKMLQLMMDRITKCYKVLVVCTDADGGLVAEVFHSDTGAWTTTDLSGLKYVSGYQYSWFKGHIMYDEDATPPSVYDCAKGRFLDIRAVGDLLRDEHFYVCLEQCALVQDRLFVLHTKEREAIQGGGFSEQGYYIAEYQAVKSGENWLKLKDHRCSNFEYPAFECPALGTSDWPVLHACKDFLLVSDVDSPDEHGLERLYDLATGKWHALSPEFLKKISGLELMCELQWDAIP